MRDMRAFILMLLATATSCAAAINKPNVLFILADDFRPDCIAAWGNPRIKTPNLDQLCARGLLFTHAYTMGSMIGAVCTPSRTMILTGRSLFHAPGKDYALWPKAMTARDEMLAPHPRTPEVVRRHLADYYACVTCLDYHIGRIIETLRALKQLDNTFIIFTGDNGLSLGDHGLMGKQNLYEMGGMHVPLVIAGPGIRHGQTGAFMYLYDLFPTVCDLTGTTIPPQVEGKSQVPIITGRATQ